MYEGNSGDSVLVLREPLVSVKVCGQSCLYLFVLHMYIYASIAVTF